MKTALFAYAGTFLTLLICDGIWLGLIARNFYRDQLGALMLPSPNLAVGALYYLFFAAVCVAVLPALSAGSIATAFSTVPFWNWRPMALMTSPISPRFATGRSP